MATNRLKRLVAAVAVVGLAGVCNALGRPTEEPPSRPVGPGWRPKDVDDALATEFPDHKLDQPLAVSDLVKRCPRVFGQQGLWIDPADDTERRLLKAQFHQQAREAYMQRVRIDIGCYGREEERYFNCLSELSDLAAELWADDARTLIPIMEELVLATKEAELYMIRRVKAGSQSPELLNAVRRHRLTAELALWKVKNGKPGGR